MNTLFQTLKMTGQFQPLLRDFSSADFLFRTTDHFFPGGTASPGFPDMMISWIWEFLLGRRSQVSFID